MTTHVDVAGTRFDYVEQGEGEPLVLVHGSASDRRTWRRQRAALAERFRVIAYSRRYHWPNEAIPPGVDYSMVQQVDDLQKLLGELDAEPAHLVGHSYGAFLCLLLAIRAPRLVRSLVLGEPPAITLFVTPDPTPLEIGKLVLTRPLTGTAIAKFLTKGVAPASRSFREGDPDAALRSFGDAVLGEGGFERLPEERKAQVRENLGNVKGELLGSGLVELEASYVRSVEAPTLLVTGERSVDVFHRLTDHLEKLLPNAERVEIPGASHLMHEEEAAAYNEAVLSFLDGKGETR